MEGNFTPFPLYKYNYLMMGHESLHKIKTTRKPESRQIDLNECFFHRLFLEALKRENSALGAGPGCSHGRDGSAATKLLLFGMRAAILII